MVYCFYLAAIFNCNFFLQNIEFILFFQQTSLEQWRKVFAVTAVIAVGTYFFYQAFGTADVQGWNFPDGRIPPAQIESDLRPLKAKKTRRRESEDVAEG